MPFWVRPPSGTMAWMNLEYFSTGVAPKSPKASVPVAAALGGAVQLEPGDDAIVRWDVTTQESLRDLYLVIIGTLIAFGAALTIEVFRKLIEIALPD